jgi:hypothetical protein
MKKYYPEFNRFKEKIIHFYNNIAVYAEELGKRITFNFQTLDNVVA